MEKHFGRFIIFADSFDDEDFGFAIGIGKTNDYVTFQVNFYKYLLEISWER